MIRKMFAALLLALGLFCASAAAASAPSAPPTAEQQAELQRLQTLLDSLKPQTGVVKIAQADATLTLGEDFYFLGAEDARRVLIDAWGNHPSSAEGVLGMVFPAGKSPLDDTWGAVVSYVGDGYVSDEDASTIDYADLLKQLQQGETAENEARTADGYASIHLVGWAQQPSYDAQKHNLIWAKELAFSDTETRTLNYDVRVLGRRGVLSMNIVSGMDALQVVGTDAGRLMNTAAFDAGARYTDYEAGVDKKAAYGIGGLVAGGAALAVAKKVGLLGILILVLKKGGVFILMGAGAAWAWLRKAFGNGKAGGEFRKPAPLQVEEPATEAAAPAAEGAASSPTSDDKPL